MTPETAATYGVRLAPQTGRIEPRDLVACRLGGELLAQRCLDRRSATWPSGGNGTRRRVDGSLNRGRQGRPRFVECQGCPMGEAYAARAPWHVPPKPSQPAEVLNRDQREARDRWLRTLPSVERVDLFQDEPVHLATTLTPDEPPEAVSAT